MYDLVSQRINMVKLQLEQRGVSDEAVLNAFYMIDKERFIPENLRAFAYADCELKNDEGFFLPTPYALAQAMENLEIFDGCKLLSIGADSYVISLLKFLGVHLTVLDKSSEKISETQSLFLESDVTFVLGNEVSGYPTGAPYDRILILGHVEDTSVLMKQLAKNGILVSIECGGEIRISK